MPTCVNRAVFALGGRITGAELFDSAEAGRASSAKVLRGYAIELSAGDVGAAPASEQAARDFLLALCDVNGTVHAGIGAGTHVRFDEGCLTGAALIHENPAVHVMAYSRSRDL